MESKKIATRRLRDRSGFTLIEIMVVIVILGLLAALVVPKLIGRTEEAKKTQARVQIKNIEQALGLFKLDNGFYPTTEQGLAALNSPPAGVPRWQGPYLKKAVPNDPWGTPYQYRAPGEHGEPEGRVEPVGAPAQPSEGGAVVVRGRGEGVDYLGEAVRTRVQDRVLRRVE